MLLIFLGTFLAQAQTTAAAPDLTELFKRIESLEQRVQQLEAKASTTSSSSGGLKKIDYQNQTIESNAPAQTSPANQQEMIKIQEQVKEFQQKAQEREKYLNELMDEN
ncbi:MAG: hypothetical protein JNM93_12815 [Bacteriovoracaceae bacterium]|nr:hypothetical protein [Bacteriovoracaceae bacterium]